LKEKVEDCDPCDKGYYCPYKGQSSSTLPLFAGYHGGDEDSHKIPNPYSCPQGFYCPEGSVDMVPCPDGSWTPDIGASSEGDCIPCQRGFFCTLTTMYTERSTNGFDAWRTGNQQFTIDELRDGTTGLTTVATYYGECLDGYICEEGAIDPEP
jgi:hypothetical protein